MIYLTAHRVRSPQTGEEGINAFRYSSGNYTWEGAPPTPVAVDKDPGVLMASTIRMRPPGNRVLSFLDVVAPFDVRVDELHEALGSLAYGRPPERFPNEWTHARLWIRFGAERALVPFWRSEIGALGAEAIVLLSANPHGPAGPARRR